MVEAGFMRLLIQRVSHAEVSFQENSRTLCNRIGAGLLVFVGIGPQTEPGDIQTMAAKITALRIFEDAAGKMNLSVRDIAGEILLVSQFTLYADTRKGNRPSFTAAAPPGLAGAHYQKMVETLEELMPGKIKTGSFGAHMEVSLTNDGPVTIWLESERAAIAG